MERQLRGLILSLVILYYIVCIYHFRQYITFENEAQMRLENNVLLQCKRRRCITSHSISMRLRTSSPPQVCPQPAMLNCHLSTSISSSHNAQRSYGSWFSPKMPSSFCSWVCLRSDHVLTTNGTLVWSAFGAQLWMRLFILTMLRRQCGYIYAVLTVVQ